MDTIIGEGLIAIGKAISGIASAWATIYVVGIDTKTFLIYTGRATADQLKDWFDFGFKRKGGL
ncbi:MAG: hypothetical protein J6V44_08110 [Methanobrevibacter sp.]|nr:hypothetical protein [Methanobrevibacter sp.]